MPTYLLHGFRWPRPLIRIHIILQNLEDAAAEWLMAPATSRVMLANFRKLYPDIMPSLPDLRLIEQYDPTDEYSKSQPYAYVADMVQEVSLGIDIDDIRGKGVNSEAWSSLIDLRDKIAPGEKVSWFVVVCGDTERWAPPTAARLEENGSGGSGHSRASRGSLSGYSGSSAVRTSEDQGWDEDVPPPKGFRKWFGIRRTKSTKSLNGHTSPIEKGPPPPLPVIPKADIKV